MARTIDIAEAYTLAENTLFAEILTATQGKQGKNGFLGHLPSQMTNVFVLNTGGGGDERLLDSGCYCNLVFNAQLTGRFSSRDSATGFIGLILKALNDDNMKQVGNLQDVHLNSMPTIADVAVLIGKSDTASLHFEVSFDFSVFASAVESFT